MKTKFCCLALLFAVSVSYSFAQNTLQTQLSDTLTAIANKYANVGFVNNVRLSANKNTQQLTITVGENLSHIPFRNENVAEIYSAITSVVSSHYPKYTISCITNRKPIEDLIPNYYRTQRIDNSRRFKVQPSNPPLITNESYPHKIDRGLENRHIALWHSHGWYYKQSLSRWEWQRARLFQTVEDMFTRSFVVPYLAPMLENAGANVLIPLERDTQTHEIIIDNDFHYSKQNYLEQNGKNEWKDGVGAGFHHQKPTYIHGENPFVLGTYRQAASVTNSSNASVVEWIPTFPETQTYAVYVSYKTVENSVSDARYTVYHLGGTTEFSINQTMGGGTWIYLGHFRFAEGKNNESGRVVLSNVSKSGNKTVTADAVKFGGGMGNIARCPTDSSKVEVHLMQPIEEMIDIFPIEIQIPSMYPPEKSGYPRFAEGARYWLQWAGAPDSIYSRTEGLDDYLDDFQSRGFWVNYLIGGSSLLPQKGGLRVPVDLAFAFHTDAGATANDSTIGTLGIFTVRNTEKKTTYENGVSRWASRDLTDIIQTQIVEDIRKTYEQEWIRRGLWNRSYSEARVPEVPTMLLELLSHQNFADMRYGLDPRFQFTVSRAIYKGMLRYLANVNGFDYEVQPLPVEQFSCQFTDKQTLLLQWTAVPDSLEPTADPDSYILYTRIDDGGFDNGVVVKDNCTTIDIEQGKIYSFKVTAVNRGGESFPSEILSAYRAPNERGEVLIVNGFERISAPESFAMDTTYAGFLNNVDAGVPYIANIGFTGQQYEFKRNTPWNDNDAAGFGASHANEEAKIIAGNTFDYPYLHGTAIKAAGYSFVSSSVKAVEKGDIEINEYKYVDLILGKQKQTQIGSRKGAPQFKAFPQSLQTIIRSYCGNGGNLLISGAYVASDLYSNDTISIEDKAFLEDVLKLKFRTSNAATNGQVKTVNSSYKQYFALNNFSYYNYPNANSYYIESPDAIEPAHSKAVTVCRYNENNRSAAVAYKEEYGLCVFGFPFETITDRKDREELMKGILTLFEKP